jgi:hypothetical protein
VEAVEAYAASLLAAAGSSGLSPAQTLGMFVGIPLGVLVLIGLTVFAWTRGRTDSRSARVGTVPRVRTTPVLGRPPGSENEPGPQRSVQTSRAALENPPADAGDEQARG